MCPDFLGGGAEREKERPYINVIKGFLILMVVVGHFGQTIGNILPESVSFIFQGFILFIYSFHMPLFVFVSGYLSKNLEKRRSKAFADLMIPYLIFQCFCGICILILTKSWEVFSNIFVPQMGAWYLLALFIWRMLLPEMIKIRHVMVYAVIISIITCCFTEIGTTMALKKVLGFMVFFLMGYYTNQFGIYRLRMMSVWSARILLLIELAAFISTTYIFHWYDIVLSIFTRAATATDFNQWYIGVLIYAVTFGLTSITGILVLNALPAKNKFYEYQGTDTMPMYISHLVLFMAVGYLVNKSNWQAAICISALCIIFSIAIFSSGFYRKLFSDFFEKVNKLIF